MSNIKCFLFILFFFIYKPFVVAQDDKYKSIFIYNFTKLIEWPADKQTDEFIITVYGNSGITSELQALSMKMKINNKPIVIKQTSSLVQLPPTQILYVCKDKTTDLSTALNDLAKKNILVITEKPMACKSGASLNFITKNGSLGFEISPSNFDKSGLKVNAQLLSLGTVVN